MEQLSDHQEVLSDVFWKYIFSRRIEPVLNIIYVVSEDIFPFMASLMRPSRKALFVPLCNEIAQSFPSFYSATIRDCHPLWLKTDGSLSQHMRHVCYWTHLHVVLSVGDVSVSATALHRQLLLLPYVMVKAHFDASPVKRVSCLSTSVFISGTKGTPSRGKLGAPRSLTWKILLRLMCMTGWGLGTDSAALQHYQAFIDGCYGEERGMSAVAG